VFDVLGREVATLVNEVQGAGTHRIQFNAEGLPRQKDGGLASGIYFYRIQTKGFVQSRKMIVLH
jgi:hypothetical protein